MTAKPFIGTKMIPRDDGRMLSLREMHPEGCNVIRAYISVPIVLQRSEDGTQWWASDGSGKRHGPMSETEAVAMAQAAADTMLAPT